MSIPSEQVDRARDYAKRYSLTLVEELGHGVHGSVFAAERLPKKGASVLHSAIKVHERENEYLRERDVYLRLQENAVTTIRGCNVPQLLRHDDDLWIIEMTVVSRPFVLDFAGAYLDKAPDFSEDVMVDWRAEKLEQFGARWPEVEAILRALEGLGIYYIDATPRNISLPD